MAIGQKDKANEFIIIAADGRSSISQGLKHYEISKEFANLIAKRLNCISLTSDTLTAI